MSGAKGITTIGVDNTKAQVHGRNQGFVKWLVANENAFSRWQAMSETAVATMPCATGRRARAFACYRNGPRSWPARTSVIPKGAVAWTEGQTAAQAIAATRDLVKDKTIPAIFEAALQSRRLFARVDILERGKRGTWHICEVKASTDVKDEHIDDVAFQLIVTKKVGLKISRVEIIHVNKDYVLKDAWARAKELFPSR